MNYRKLLDFSKLNEYIKLLIAFDFPILKERAVAGHEGSFGPGVRLGSWKDAGVYRLVSG